MKRVGNLWNRIVDLDNIALAAHKAFRGKRMKVEVRDFTKNFHENLTVLRNSLIDGSYSFGDYHYFKIFDPKERQICAAPLKERILHHAVMNVCHEYFDRRLISDTYATRPQKGIYKALERLRRKAVSFEYYAKLDVRKYYDSIHHSVLKSQLRRIFKDKHLLSLFDRLIESYSVGSERGLPIGNLSSQYFANTYLSALDHFMKEKRGIAVYIRYMDDVIMLSNDRVKLKAAVNDFIEYSRTNLLLEIKPPLIGRIRNGVNFLGYRVYPRRMYLSSRSKLRFRKKLLTYTKRLSSGEYSEKEFNQHIVPLTAFCQQAVSRSYRAECIRIASQEL